MARKRRPSRAGVLTELSPLKIFTQIISLQLTYYLSAFVLILFSAMVSGERINLDMLLSWRSLRGDTTAGWMLGMVWMLNSLTGVIAIIFLIHRSKLVLDFALTLHFIHFLVVSFYSHSLPRNALWWGSQLISACVMTTLSVWVCQRHELRPISFGANLAASSSNNAVGPISNRDDEQNFECESERTRNTNGAYEMVGMKSKVPNRAA